MSVAVFWPHSPEPARLRLPFPALGVRAFDGTGQARRSGALLNVMQLAGWRLLLQGGAHGAHARLHLRAGTQPERLIRVHLPPDAQATTLRLQDCYDTVQDLLACEDEVDAQVMMRVHMNDAPPFVLKIARYGARLTLLDDQALLDAPDTALWADAHLDALRLHALRLACPDEVPTVLSMATSHGAPTGAWSLTPLLRGSPQRSAGAWLLYPPADAPLPFRPTLFRVAGDPPLTSRLAEAIHITETRYREPAMDAAIAAMADDFSDPGWTLLETLATHLAHLPLATLDLWRRLAQSSAGMAALALRWSHLPEGFVARFADELPFAWEQVRLADWQAAVARLHAQCQALRRPTDPEPASAQVFEAMLKRQCDAVCEHAGALDYLLAIARGAFASEAEAAQLPRLRMLAPQARTLLLDGEQSERMAVLRRQHEGVTPTPQITALLNQAQRDPALRTLLCHEVSADAAPLVNLPLLLAAQAMGATTFAWPHDTALMAELRALKDADPAWFDHAFNQTVLHYADQPVRDVLSARQ